VTVSLDVFELLLQLGQAIANAAAIQVEIAFTRAHTPLAFATRCRLPQPRRHIFQACHLHLQLRLAAAGMAMKDLHDHARPVENLRAGGVLEIACLTRRYLMIDDDEFRPTCAVRLW